MKTILCWGNPESQFHRLGISPAATYDNLALDHLRFSAWDLSESDYSRLCADAIAQEARSTNDPTYEDSWTAAGASWRYSEGANISMSDGPVRINGQHLIGGHASWRSDEEPEDDDTTEIPSYPNLLDYFCDEIGASTGRNVAAVAAEMARENQLSLGELLRRTMPVQTSAAS